MSQLSRTEWEALYGTTGTVFPDNTTGEISEGDMRTFGKNASDSIPFTRNDSYTWASPQVSTTGTNTYAATPSPAITAYATGQEFKIKFTNASTGVSTLNLNGLGAKKIFINPTTQATTDHILAGQIVKLAYDAALDSASGGFLMLGSAATSGSTAAENVTFTPAGNIAATDVQAAIEELDTEKFSIVQSRRSREITASAAVVQADDNGMIITNSGTPINITLDQLTANLAGNETTKISAKNIGAGAVTFVNGTGVSAVGSLVLPGAVGTNYPTAFIEYETPTAPRVSIGGTESGRVAVAISTGTLTLDINNEIRRDFDLTATETGNFTIAFSNTTNWKESSLTLRLTGTIAITMPSTVRMENFENTVGRWNTSTRVLTLIGVTASPFEIRFSPQGSIIECFATDRFV